MGSALHAVELADTHGHCRMDVPTSGATLRAWEEPVGDSDLFTVPHRLVFEHGAEDSKAGAADVLCERRQLDHSSNVQIFNAQDIELSNEPGGELVQRVLTSVRDAGVYLSYPQALTLPPLTFRFAACQHLLGASKPLGILRRVPRVGDPCPVGQSCQPRDSQVDPDRPSGLGERVLHLVEAKRHKVSPGAVLGYRDCGGSACELATPLDVKATDFGKGEVAVYRIPFESTGSELGGLSPVLALKARELRALSKEIGVSRLEVPQRLL